MVALPATARHAGLVGSLREREREVAAIRELLDGRGRLLLLEGRAGIGKTSLIEVACSRAAELGFEVLRARGSELESGFAFGVVRQLFERRLAGAGPGQRAALLAGPAAAVRPLLAGELAAQSTGQSTGQPTGQPTAQPTGQPAGDSSFAVLHGLYWLVVNLAAGRPLLLAVDDAHWADEPSLRWLAYLARRLDGLAAAVLAALRPGDPAAMGAALLAVRAEAAAVLRPALLSEQAVSAVVRTAGHADADGEASDELCAAVYAACGGNPLYLTELLRAADRGGRPLSALEPAEVLAGGLDEIARQVITRVRGLGPDALRLAQALAVLGDGGELRHAATIAGLPMTAAARLAGGLTRAEVLAAEVPAAGVPAAGDRPRFVHPVIRDALEAVLDGGERDRAHRDAARLLHADLAPPGQVAAHLTRVRPAGDGWVLARLREAARAAMDGGAPQAAAGLLDRALAEPPSPAHRAGVLREAARAQVTAGRERAFALLEEALRVAAGPRVRAEIALEVAEAYAALFRWVDAVDVIERALAELGAADEELAARLEGELVVCGLHDARRAPQVAPVLARLASRRAVAASEPVAVAQAMAMLLAGRPASQIAARLDETLECSGPEAGNWDTRAALLWVLVVAERFGTVADALGPALEQVHRSGSARGLVAAYSTLGLLKLRLGALPEADAAAGVALYVLQEGDFEPGLGFAATVLADVAVEAGQLDEAQRLLDLLPGRGWPAGVGTVLIPAARGRLRLAQGRAAEALAEFQACGELFGADVWGMPIRETGYVHARSGAALALLRLGRPEDAVRLADAELADVRIFGAPRALGIALRVAGLARGGPEGLVLLRESAAALDGSPALLERARSLAELGAALRRDGQRAAARDPLARALELAAGCGAGPLAARVRDELRAAGARPRRPWRTGVDALTPSELRVARLAADGRSNREIAGELYVTLKAIEGHLARAYAKLGIEGRGQLASALAVQKTGPAKTGVPALQRSTRRTRDGRAINSPTEGDFDGDDRARGVREGNGDVQRP
jgi:DNA-binding CsgD family transcriptional regulator